MEKILKELGFENMTGLLYKHKVFGIIHISEDDTPADLAKKIYDRGYGMCQEDMKAVLGIRSLK